MKLPITCLLAIAPTLATAAPTLRQGAYVIANAQTIAYIGPDNQPALFTTNNGFTSTVPLVARARVAEGESVSDAQASMDFFSTPTSFGGAGVLT